jgi:hypothetical protein
METFSPGDAKMSQMTFFDSKIDLKKPSILNTLSTE